MEVAPADAAVSDHHQQRDRGRTTAAPPAAAWAEDSTTAVGVWEAAALGRNRQQPAERPLVLHRHPDTELEFATRGLLWYALLTVVCTAAAAATADAGSAGAEQWWRW